MARTKLTEAEFNAAMRGLTARKRKAVVPSEREVQKSVLTYLNGIGVVAWRVNSGAARLPASGGKTQLVRFNGAAGHSDIAGVLPAGVDPEQTPPGRFLACEVKRVGGKLTALQAAFLERMRRQGALAFIATSIDDVRRELRAAGYNAQ